MGSRAERMGLRAAANVFLYSATRLEDVLREVVAMRPRAVIVDSIQTVYLDDVAGSAGSVSQARAPARRCPPRGCAGGSGILAERADMLAFAVACAHLAPLMLIGGSQVPTMVPARETACHCCPGSHGLLPQHTMFGRGLGVHGLLAILRPACVRR